MPLGQAVSGRYKGRLAVVLAGVAGYVNVVTLVYLGAMTSHLSGTVTHLGQSLVQTVEGQPAWLLAYWVLLVVAFFVGAMTSACITETTAGRRRIVRAVGLEAGVLALVALGMTFPGPAAVETLTTLPVAMTLAASFAMGLQNATITRVSRAVVRTTHVTGIVTDMGIEAGAFLTWAARRHPLRETGWHPVRLVKLLRAQEAFRRFALHGRLLLGFFVGAIGGTLGLQLSPGGCLWLPVAVLAAVACREALLHRHDAPVDTNADVKAKARG